MGEHDKARARVNDAAQVLQAILQTHYLRYWLITSWALALLATINPINAILWFAGTLTAGAIRSAFEKRLAGKVGAGAPELVSLTGAYHNLLRMWAEV